MQRIITRLGRGYSGVDHPDPRPGPSSGRVYDEDAPGDVVILHHEEATSPQSEENPASAVQRVLAGDEVVISHIGASQYTTPGGGVSACGIAALNCLRVVFEKEREGVRGGALLEQLMTREVAEVCRSSQVDGMLSGAYYHGIRKSPRYAPGGQASLIWKWTTSSGCRSLSGPSDDWTRDLRS